MLCYLISADFLERSVNVEEGHVVSFAGDELLACCQHLLSPGWGVVENSIHWQQRNDAQYLLRTGELWRQKDRLQDRAKEVK